MTAPLPTRVDEIVKEIVVRHLTIVKVCDLNVYEGEQAEQIERYLKDHLSARLRPAFEAEKARADDNFASYERINERDALRTSLARKDEALRACVEALTKLSRRHKDLCSGGEECRLHDEADAALARAQEAEK